MAATFVMSKDGIPLMPTTNVKKVRKLLKTKRATIYKYRPFTIQLTYDTPNATQPVEIAVDTGYEHVGVSVKSEKHEYKSAQFDLLKEEKKRHASQKKYRRTRRNRLRYRKPRFDNRKQAKGWIAPSLKNKADRQVDIVETFASVCPITSIIIECGQFDTQVLTAVDNQEPIPEGLDYQHGPKYGFDTLREAVFARDDYKCMVCKKSAIKYGIILRLHHINYREGDRSNRMSNLGTVCVICHTTANHQPGGALYDLKPKTKGFQGAAFMNTVKWYIYHSLESKHPDIVHITYGSVTKRERLDRNIEKSHANDAYCIGNFHPKHRCRTNYFAKARRHNRVLSKFYDAKYIDSRDQSKKTGKQLSSGRTNRNHKKDKKNLRIYRLKKVEKGYTTIRRINYSIKPGDVALYKGKVYAVDGMKNNGTAVKLITKTATVNPNINNIKILSKSNGWKKLA